jgi:hypothetical protein
MALSNLLIVAAIFAASATLYGFRATLFSALRRFDARNHARKADEWRARFDGQAHYRQTVALAEEQFETVGKIQVRDPRTGEAVLRYQFLGEDYASLKDAEEARHAAIIGKAREFYRDLDKIFLGRQGPRDRSMRAPAEDGGT